jgi:hypothetical protein
VPAKAPSGRLKRAGKKNFILAKAALTKYTKREEVKCIGREKGVDNRVIFIKHRVSFLGTGFTYAEYEPSTKFEQEQLFEPKVEELANCFIG